MPLRFASEPKNGSALVRAGLNQISARPSPLSARAIDFAALNVTSPHAVYDLHADEIAGGKGLASAHATGFRYLVEGGGGPVAAAEVHTDASGTANLLANVNYGDFVPATARAFAQLANLAEVRANSYEVRLLRFSAIPLLAIWLKPDKAGADIIYPLSSVPGTLDAEKAYSADDFLKGIMPMAQKRAGTTGASAVP